MFPLKVFRRIRKQTEVRQIQTTPMSPNIFTNDDDDDDDDNDARSTHCTFILRE